MRRIILGLGFLLCAPVIAAIMAREYWLLWRRRPVTTLPPETRLPPAFPAWAAIMERGRRLQGLDEAR